MPQTFCKKLNYLAVKATKLLEEEIEELRASLGSTKAGPFEVIAENSQIERYKQVIEDLWSPIKNLRTGRFIVRYVATFIGEPDSKEPIGGQMTSPTVFIYSPPEEVEISSLCFYAMKRAVLLRQIRVGVGRNLFTKGRIIARTNKFLEEAGYWNEIYTAYHKDAEQVGDGDA